MSSSNATGTICPVFFQNGICADERAGTCEFEHAAPICMNCKQKFENLADYDKHVLTPEHLARARGAERKYRCTICMRVIDALNWDSHVSGQRHRSEANTHNLPPDVAPEEVQTSVPNHQYCSPCDAHVTSQDWARHIASTRHVRSEQFARFLSAIEEGSRDRNGVAVSKDGDFGIVDKQTASGGVEKNIKIRGDDQAAPTIRLVRCVLASGGSMCVLMSFHDKMTRLMNDLDSLRASPPTLQPSAARQLLSK